jgi:hypothetical protein
MPVAEVGYDYTWRDSDFCDDCHVHDYANERYAQSRHVGVTTCHDCHRVPISHYPRNLYGVVFKTYAGPEDIHTPHVPSHICASCHLDGHEAELTGPMTPELLAEIVKVDESPLHRVHLEAKGREPSEAQGGGPPEGEFPSAHSEHAEGDDRITCLDCHGSGDAEAHRFETASSNCVDCHRGIAPHAGQLGDLECRDCHFDGFLGAVSAN